MLQVGTTITAQQKYGQVFTGEIVDGSYTTAGGIRYVVHVDDDNARKLGHFMSAGLCYVYADEIIPNAVDLDKFKGLCEQAWINQGSDYAGPGERQSIVPNAEQADAAEEYQRD